MSATFKNTKKKLSQGELRRFMNDHMEKLQKNVKKIDSPLAKYNEIGQLTCVLCQSVVRSEAVWTVHLNSKQHKQNVNAAKQLKDRTNNFTSLKRSLTPPSDVQTKKIKGILKNSSNGNSEVPEDFFDSKNSEHDSPTIVTSKESLVKKNVENEPVQNNDALPEGFFDDPKQDAKARNVDYKDPTEEEWEKFQKVIRQADSESAAIIAEDQEEATHERQIDEIEEQMKNWSRVLTLERKKIEAVNIVDNSATTQSVPTDSSTDTEDDFIEHLDWRSKKSFK